MTVSEEALEPLWCPAQSALCVRRIRVGRRRRLTVLGCAVLVWVVAAEDHAVAVSGGDLVQPSDDGGGWALSEVLLEDLGCVPVDEDYRKGRVVRFGMASHIITKR